MNTYQAWIKAMRLRTLPLALASIGLGAFLAAFYDEFRLKIFVLSAVTTLLLQILSNLANDYGDTQHGADSVNREGPSRMVQAGFIKPGNMLRAIILLSVLTLATGLWLLFVAFGKLNLLFLLFFVLGVGAIAAAVKYTMGKSPYGYKGLGDVFVLIFFGLVGVCGSYFLHTGELTAVVFIPAMSFGLLSTGVLNLNNIRDIKSDREAGKISIPVRLGRNKAIIYHWALLIAAFAGAICYTLITFRSEWQFIFLLTLPLFIKNGMAVRKYETPSKLDPYLKQLAVSSLLFSLTFGIGLIISG